MEKNARSQQEETTIKRAQVLGMQYTDTSKLQKQVFKNILSVDELNKLKAVPLYADEHNIHFGITTTASQQTIPYLKKRFTDVRLAFSIISEVGFDEYMLLYNPPKKVEYEDINIAKKGDQGKKIIDDVSATLQEVKSDDMLAYLVSQAYKLGSSDIHLENQRENVRVRFRVDGVLHPVAFVTTDKYRLLLASLASSANISTGVKEAQTGHISREYTLATGEKVLINMRVEAVPTVYGIDAVLRLFNMNIEMFKLENLGLSDKEMQVVADIISHPSGLVLAVGPTGSGKTTTLYSLINTLNTDERKIITLEDPVEYNIPGVVQIPVAGQMEGHDFAEKLRAVLRLDPDVVMIGEIRDPDTSKTALQGALTGHLVLSTFHASSAAAALTRLVDMVGVNPLFSNAIRLVMAQRLVRRLDKKSAVAYEPDEAMKKGLSAVLDRMPPKMQKPDLNGVKLYRPGVSEENPFGYSGQMAIREQLLMTPGVREILRRPPLQISTSELEEMAISEGMTTMAVDGVLKAIAGLTSIEEVYRVIG